MTESSWDVSVSLGCWVLGFTDSLVGLFTTLYLLISHDDLETGAIEPMELSNTFNLVK